MAAKKKAKGEKKVGGFVVLDELPANPKKRMPARQNKVATLIHSAYDAGAFATGGWVVLDEYPSSQGATAAYKKLVAALEGGKAELPEGIELDIEVRKFEYVVEVSGEDVTKRGSRLLARQIEDEADNVEYDTTEDADESLQADLLDD